MTLLITNDDVEAVLEMGRCIDALEIAFRAYATGGAVNRPRSHTYTDRGDGKHYLFKSMDGSVAELGVHAIRLSSDLTHEFVRDGRRIREKIPAAPGRRWVGLVLLFDIDELVPLAIIQDGYLQRMRVGATSALAARFLARPASRVVGLVGTGWQAGAQLLGLHERGTLEQYRVYGPDRQRCRAFCDEFTQRLGQEVRPVTSGREAVQGADIVALATNSHDPVIAGDWLTPGQHVGSVQGHELDWGSLERADLIGVRSHEEATFHYAPGHAPVEAAERKHLPDHVKAKTVALGDIVAGRTGRTDESQVTLFTGGGTGASSGLGIQFAAVANAVYEAVRKAGRGREIPTEWFTEHYKP
ncbi:MAG: ornithine cyclodeaminase family protein [Egibacteraceae bacterium]